MRILIVEDEPHLLAALAATLREEGYAVDTAEDGEVGLYKARAWDYDAVVLDINLPRVDGWGVLAELRRSKTTPVLILTANDSTAHRVRGLDGGADDYLVKPFELDELLARLRALIRRAAGAASTRIELGDVVVDTAARTVSKAGRAVRMTAREYSLVEMLALHRHKVVARTTLYEKLLDESDDTVSKVIEVHVFNVRKKLGREFITTRRGHGYLIDV